MPPWCLPSPLLAVFSAPPPGGCHASAVAVGKDAVPRMSVATLGRLMDEMVTSLARCRQPKIKV